MREEHGDTISENETKNIDVSILYKCYFINKFNQIYYANKYIYIYNTS